MKRILLGILAVLFLACATRASADGGTPTKGSFDWAMGLVEDYVNAWHPGAHLSCFSGGVDKEGLLLQDDGWLLTFTSKHGDESKTWNVDYYGKVGPARYDIFGPGPAIVYDNQRIRRVLKPVLQYLEDNYVKGTYYFGLGAEYKPSDLPGHVCALVTCYSENLYELFNAQVDTKSYEILGL